MKIGRFSLKPKAIGAADDYNDPPRPFMDHLIDLRDCVIQCAVAWGICEVAIIPFAPGITRWLIAPAEQSMSMIQGLTWTAGFDILLKIMLWGGTALSLPFLLFFILRFVFPGLKRSERTIIVFCLSFSTVLFGVGVWMAYAATLNIAFQILQKLNAWMGIKVEILTLDQHVEIVIKTIMAFGLAFQMPLLLLALGWIGVVPSSLLRDKRRHAIVIIFVIAMVLTPPDPVSQIIMALPMCILYEICIWVIRLRELAKGKPREEPAAA
jgi:sec-independent protein translocase protein TatC